MSFHYVRDTTRPAPYPTGSDPMALRARMLEGSALWADTDTQGQYSGRTYPTGAPHFTLIPEPHDPNMLG
jgi:hypothetical protein